MNTVLNIAAETWNREDLGILIEMQNAEIHRLKAELESIKSMTERIESECAQILAAAAGVLDDSQFCASRPKNVDGGETVNFVNLTSLQKP